MKKNHALIFYGLLTALNIYFAVTGWPSPLCFINIGFAIWMAWSAFRLVKPRQ